MAAEATRKKTSRKCGERDKCQMTTLLRRCCGRLPPVLIPAWRAGDRLSCAAGFFLVTFGMGNPLMLQVQAAGLGRVVQHALRSLEPVVWAVPRLANRKDCWLWTCEIDLPGRFSSTSPVLCCCSKAYSVTVFVQQKAVAGPRALKPRRLDLSQSRLDLAPPVCQPLEQPLQQEMRSYVLEMGVFQSRTFLPCLRKTPILSSEEAKRHASSVL